MNAELSSNVVNYLVWRYLQESGYGNAALQLSRCWNRDPDSLPFAKNVSHRALVGLLQDGIWFDRMQAEATGQRHYDFGRDHGTPFSVRNGTLLTLDQGIPAHQLAEEANGAVLEPPARKGPLKRKRGKANGVDTRSLNAQVNGDVMDVDQNGGTHVTNSVRADSEAVVSEAESPTVAEIPISTLSIGLSTEVQTEQITDLAPNTLFGCSVKDPDKVVFQTLWGTAEEPLFLAAGKSLLRLHLINSTPSPQTLDLRLPLNNFAITAVCWNSNGEVSVSAQEERANEHGEIMKTDKLFKLIEGGSDYQVVSSTAGVVTTLRWNESKQLLLAISSDGTKGSIKIWKDPGDEQIPAWTAFTETTIFDAVWISDSAFVVCGVRIFEIYEIGELLAVQRSFNTQVTWEKVKYDASSGTLAALGIEGQTSYLGTLRTGDSTDLQTQEYPDPYFMDLDFHPRNKSNALGISSTSHPPQSSGALLATCATSGVARIWDTSQPSLIPKRLSTVDDSQANTIAFSPDGSLLAAGGPDAVTVWNVERGEVPLATWRAQDFGNDKWDASVDGEFTLGWIPDGSGLSISLGNQIAIIPLPR